MKNQLKSCLTRRLLSLVGAAIFLLPLTVTAQINTTTSCHLDPAHGPQAVVCVVTITNQGSSISAGLLQISGNATPGSTYTTASVNLICAQPVVTFLPSPFVCGNVFLAPSQSTSLSIFVKVPQGGAFKLCGAGGATSGTISGIPVCQSMVIPGPAACLPGQTDTRVPGYCCDGNPGVASFTCWKKWMDPNVAR